MRVRGISRLRRLRCWPATLIQVRLYRAPERAVHSAFGPVNPLKNCLGKICACGAVAIALLAAPSGKSGQKQRNGEDKPAANPAQIELLEASYRFEANGDSRKEVHVRVKINNELGVQQFARLKFDYNRACQTVEIPLARITHPRGGTAEILPRAITDNVNPAVADYPAYQDLREKSVRILGLGPGDLLEYRVITTTTHPLLAPDFWLEHTFDRTGVVSEESLTLDLPSGPKVRTRFSLPPSETSSAANGSRSIYKWARTKGRDTELEPPTVGRPDLQVSTFASWEAVSNRIGALPDSAFSTQIYSEAGALDRSPRESDSPEFLYRVVAQKIKTVDLPLDFSAFILREPQQILSSGYGTPEEKARLLAVLLTKDQAESRLAMYSESRELEGSLPSPGLLTGVLLEVVSGERRFIVSPGLEVAPFGMVPSALRGKQALSIGDKSSPATGSPFTSIPEDLPFASTQNVNLDAAIDTSGRLTAKVKYEMRGDNELALRVAFHQTPREKWKGVAQLLALSDGFRGEVTNVSASDPLDTKDPFSVEYEVVQPKFVNWEKKPVRIPAILPLLGLPDPPAAGSAADIKLGTPLDVDLHSTVKLPVGTVARVPTGTSVTRDYAAFSSNYSAQGDSVSAARKIRFLMPQLPADRAMDYNAFLHSVQNDQAQEFVLERRETPTRSAGAQGEP